MKKLIVIDMQNDFVTGVLGTKEAQKIVPNVIERCKEYDKRDIIFTRDTHYENYMDTLEGQKLPVPHCIKDTEGWNIIDELKEFWLNDYTQITNKETFGSEILFEDANELTDEEEFNEKDAEFELCGVCTDICVVSNALALRMALPNIKIIVRANCCAGVTPELHEAALKVMESCQIDVIR